MSVPIDQSFVEYVVKSLVENPDAVSIDRTIDDRGVLLMLTVDPEDLGRVIGKRGSTAQSLRTLLRALGMKNDERFNLKIVDNGPERPAPVADGRSASEDRQVGDDDHAHEVHHEDHAHQDYHQESVAEDEAEPEEADETNEMIERHKRELADLDDLDI